MSSWNNMKSTVLARVCSSHLYMLLDKAELFGSKRCIPRCMQCDRDTWTVVWRSQWNWKSHRTCCFFCNNGCFFHPLNVIPEAVWIYGKLKVKLLYFLCKIRSVWHMWVSLTHNSVCCWTTENVNVSVFNFGSYCAPRWAGKNFPASFLGVSESASSVQQVALETRAWKPNPLVSFASLVFA